MKPIRIRVPGTSANLGPGFDSLALALRIFNTFRVEYTPDDRDLVLREVTGTEAGPLDPRNNLFCDAYRRWEEDTGRELPGVQFTVDAGIPMTRGLGSSAAAIVAGLRAAAYADGDKEPRDRIVRLASLIEGHADNAVAAAIGGITVGFIDGDEVYATHIVNHLTLGIAVFIPDEPFRTVEARALLPRKVGLEDAVFNIGRATYLATSLVWGRWDRIGPAMKDRLHQPYRATILPALDKVIRAAEEAGAYGAALSGGGPTVIALGPKETADQYAAAMEARARERGWAGRSLVTGIHHLGVELTEEENT